jgi:hypothetical protein
MQQEITEAVLALLKTWDANKFNISLGFFDGYAKVESDTLGKRFCNVKLANKDANGDDIPLLDVPLMYIGNKNFIVDFEIEKGDELLIAFTDRTLEAWKPTSGTVPQETKNPVKDSMNHGIAIPICSVHNANLVSSIPVDSSAIGLRAKSGKKIELGNGTAEVLNLLNDNLTEVIAGLKFLRDTITFTNGGGTTGPPTNAAVLNPIIANLETTQTALDTIKT